MPLFGGGEKRQEDDDALRAEIDRIAALTLQQLAAEAMTKGFGAGAPGAGGAAVRPSDVSGTFIPADSSHGLDQGMLVELADIVVEGVQVLEHACLVRIVVSGSGGVYNSYVVTTRLGRVALEQNAVERVIAGGGIS